MASVSTATEQEVLQKIMAHHNDFMKHSEAARAAEGNRELYLQHLHAASKSSVLVGQALKELAKLPASKKLGGACTRPVYIWLAGLRVVGTLSTILFTLPLQAHRLTSRSYLGLCM